jgi:Flp pilus assembly pilin Flp
MNKSVKILEPSTVPRYAINYTFCIFRGYYGLYFLRFPAPTGSSPSCLLGAAEAHGCRVKPAGICSFLGGMVMHCLYKLWRDEEGQDIAEYAVMLAVILVIVVGTIRLIGSNANNVFSNVASSIQ